MESKTCTRKDCRLRTGVKIPEDKRDYSHDYPYNAFGKSCNIVGCQIRRKEVDDGE